MAKPQEMAFQKCRCFGGPISLVHFSGKAFTFNMMTLLACDNRSVSP